MLLNKHNFELAKLASKDGGRYIINGLHITAAETIETDGVQLVRITAVDTASDQFPAVEGLEATDSWEPFTLETKHALEIAKAIPAGRKTFEVLKNAVIGKTENGTACMGVTDLDSPKVFRPKKMEGRYPDYNAVTPKIGDETISICLDANHLVPLVQQLQRFIDDRSSAPVIIRIKDKNSPIRMECANVATGQKAVAVLMPRRFEASTEIRYPGVDRPRVGPAPCDDCGALPDRALCSRCVAAVEAAATA